MDQKFYICEQCCTILEIVKNSGVPIVCCGRKMTEIIPETAGPSAEKHLPVYHVQGEKVFVTVGSTEHPMTEEHHIAWILLQTREGLQRKWLKPGEEPKACFVLSEGDTIEAVYAFCNLHSIWKA